MELLTQRLAQQRRLINPSHIMPIQQSVPILLQHWLVMLQTVSCFLENREKQTGKWGGEWPLKSYSTPTMCLLAGSSAGPSHPNNFLLENNEVFEYNTIPHICTKLLNCTIMKYSFIYIKDIYIYNSAFSFWSVLPINLLTYMQQMGYFQNDWNRNLYLIYTFPVPGMYLTFFIRIHILLFFLLQYYDCCFIPCSFFCHHWFAKEGISSFHWTWLTN